MECLFGAPASSRAGLGRAWCCTRQYDRPVRLFPWPHRLSWVALGFQVGLEAHEDQMRMVRH